MIIPEGNHIVDFYATVLVPNQTCSLLMQGERKTADLCNFWGWVTAEAACEWLG